MKKRRPKKCQFFEKTTRMTWDWDQDWKTCMKWWLPCCYSQETSCRSQPSPHEPSDQSKRCTSPPRWTDPASMPPRTWSAAWCHRVLTLCWEKYKFKSLVKHMLFGHVLRLWLRSCFIIIVLLKVGYQRSKFGRLAENAVTELAHTDFERMASTAKTQSDIGEQIVLMIHPLDIFGQHVENDFRS